MTYTIEVLLRKLREEFEITNHIQDPTKAALYKDDPALYFKTVKDWV